MAIQIRCINKTPRQAIDERIKAIGGVNPNGDRWSLTLDEAIAAIEAGKYSFFVSVGGRSVDVVVAISAARRKYLKTVADNTTVDNLLSLPECP